MLEQAVDYVPEVPAHQGFATGQRNVHYAAVGHLLNYVHYRLMWQFAQLGIRRRHIAVLAAVVALAGYGPVYSAYEAVVMHAVFLIGIERRGRVQLLDPALFYALAGDVAHLLRHNAQRHIALAVQQRHAIERILIKKVHHSQFTVHYRIWQLLPAAQLHIRYKAIILSHCLSSFRIYLHLSH